MRSSTVIKIELAGLTRVGSHLHEDVKCAHYQLFSMKFQLKNEKVCFFFFVGAVFAFRSDIEVVFV